MRYSDAADNRSIGARLSDFDSIDLCTLDRRVTMLERVDRKFIVPPARLYSALAPLAEHFDVLEIGGKRAFGYVTAYFDDADLTAYYDHQRSRRKRCKIRLREYTDTGDSYLEMKLKGKRGNTFKKRLRISGPDRQLDESAVDFIDRSYREMYGAAFEKALAHKLTTRFDRVTFASRDGEERVTVDTCLSFESSGSLRIVDSGNFIVETKSTRSNSTANRIFRSMHLHPTGSISKYCVGMAATGQVKRWNRFLPAMRRLGLLEGPTRAIPSQNSPN